MDHLTKRERELEGVRKGLLTAGSNCAGVGGLGS